ncbi:unnamed protein product [Rotaria sp. Silwood1]|nr:unnamed protein product [Rotaria sp. Silwood1]CAF3500061.1 unnamed protein product [Rotaria sp. Silwood1]CAF3618075.1 unnamed protein product [Rotaria sp. Silwood1]CAF3648237.1 unnamed protein product [Rotaria sp. Silwood1]CAF4736916.1 unnamed protein product [Rotaria sp. Silwood1]
MLAAVYIDTIFTLSCATIYTWLYFIITVLYQGYCPTPFYPTESDYQATNSSVDVIKYLSYYGTGPSLIAIQLCIDIPRYLCLAYVCIRLPTMLVSKFHQYRHDKERYDKKYTQEEQAFSIATQPYSVETLYVRNLFRSPNVCPPSRSFVAHLLPKSVYEWRDDFRFSSRILCIYAALFLVLFVLTIKLIIRELPNLPVWQIKIESLTGSKNTNPVDNQANSTSQNQTSSTSPLSAVKVPFFIAIFTALIITVIQVVVLLTSIRRHLLQIFRGNHSEIPKKDNLKNLLYATGNLHFAGFFIGYAVWGYILCFLLTFSIYYIIGKLLENDGKLFEQVLTIIIPIFLLSTFKVYINLFVAKYIFLQKQNQILAINNHRVSMILLYFDFFLDAFLGLAASFTRILNTFVITIIYTARLDYSPLGRQLEYRDAGFCAYSGFIQMEAIHRNPIMLAFSSILLVHQRTKQSKSLSKARQRWCLAVLLIHNPSLIIMRKAILARKEGNLALLQTMKTSEFEHSTNENFEKALKAMLRSEYVGHGYISSNNSDNILSKL